MKLFRRDDGCLGIISKDADNGLIILDPRDIDNWWCKKFVSSVSFSYRISKKPLFKCDLEHPFDVITRSTNLKIRVRFPFSEGPEYTFSEGDLEFEEFYGILKEVFEAKLSKEVQ